MASQRSGLAMHRLVFVTGMTIARHPADNAAGGRGQPGSRWTR
jgi:hypothetical protein